VLLVSFFGFQEDAFSAQLSAQPGFSKKKRFKLSVKLRLTASSARQLRGESPSPCRAPQTVLKRIIQNTSQKGPVFGHMGAVSVDFNQNRFENTRFR